MNVILLAAGLGTRLRPLTDILPKCLMPIHGRPQLEYWLRALDAACGQGGADVLVNTHYLPELVRAYLAASPWAARVRQAHEEELLGTGGTLLANSFAAPGPVMLVHADNLCDADLNAFAGAHIARAAGVAITMMSFRTDSPRSCGILELDGRGVVRAFHEKVADPPGNLANAAVYIVEPEVTAFIASHKRPVVDFSTEVIPNFKGRIQTWENTCYHRDIGNVGSFLAAQDEYPAPTPAAPEGPDGWRELCLRDGGALPRAFAMALAGALELPFAEGVAAPGGTPALLYAGDDRALEAALSAPKGIAALAPGSIVAIGCSAGAPSLPRSLIQERGCRSLTVCSTTSMIGL
ncbi:MAG: nucleotidyltransferase family protein [Humidesulfovibrio sp.]|nr:nucleotidyltransferase family protein [Humidesulfovibrio sp.]